MLMVVFGAGASYDSAPTLVGTLITLLATVGAAAGG
jgi:hypothetical protein